LVIHDELDIPFGQIRSRVGGGSAGHNGVKSITAHVGENFGRLRIGINNQLRIKNDEKNFVLKTFSKEEQIQLPNLQKEITSLLTEYIYSELLPSETRDFIL
ncbi:aminoacyl-tRNA hydrolase, partial [Candidatus Saccharibacteria bacterium]|nr:aminoacyl-tRNA hydrolase [Candidatus Saccharibacteria bacterium]